MADCEHGMPKPSTCIQCMNDDGLGAEPPAPVAVEYVFEAKWSGQCPECNLPTVPGQRLAAMTNGRYVHEACA